MSTIHDEWRKKKSKAIQAAMKQEEAMDPDKIAEEKAKAKRKEEAEK